mgnify:CR=1
MVYYIDYVLVGDEYKWAAMTGKDAHIVSSNTSLEELMKNFKERQVVFSQIAGFLLDQTEDPEASLAEYKNARDYLDHKKNLEQMQRDLDAPDPFDPE